MAKNAFACIFYGLKTLYFSKFPLPNRALKHFFKKKCICKMLITCFIKKYFQPERINLEIKTYICTQFFILRTYIFNISSYEYY